MLFFDDWYRDRFSLGAVVGKEAPLFSIFFVDVGMHPIFFFVGFGVASFFSSFG